MRFLALHQLLQAVDLRLVFTMPRVERKREGVLGADDGVAINISLRKGVHPAQDRLMGTAAKDQLLDALGDPPRLLLPVRRSNHAVDRFFNAPVGVQPTTAALKTFPGLRRLGAAITLTEELADQMMQPPPATGSIQRDEEQVAQPQPLQALFGVRLAECLSERPADTIEHRNPEHEGARASVQPCQEDFTQIFDEAAVGPGEMPDELAPIGQTGERQRNELKRRGPAFGFAEQTLQILLRQILPKTLAVELRGFLGIEAQLPHLQLKQLSPHAQAAQPQARLLASADDLLQRARCVVHEPIEDLENFR